MQRLGDYELLDELGRGGMGVVYRARGPDGRQVALKVLHQTLDLELVERFRREASIGSALIHPALARVSGTGAVDGRCFLVMDLLEGPTLAQRIARQGPVAPAEAVAWARRLAEALDHVHAHGIVHRDVKPANVILTDDGPVLTDLGLAKMWLEGQGLTASGVILGTPAYMAPEQALGDKTAIGPATDVYGLGATLFAMLVGHAPFSAGGQASLLEAVVEQPVPLPPNWDRVPTWLQDVCLRCLDKSPRRRFASTRELGRALALEQAPSRAPRVPRVVAGVTLTLLALLGGGVAAARKVGAASPSPAGSPTPTLTTEPSPAVADAAPSLTQLGIQHFRSSDLETACDVLEQALAEDPRDAEAAKWLVDGLLRLQRDEQALAVCDALLAHLQTRSVAWAIRGSARLRLGQAAEAEADLERALELNPSDGEALSSLSVVHFKQERPELAMQALEQLVRLDPGDGDSYRKRAVLAALYGRSEEARRDFDRAVALSPELDSVWTARGRFFLDQGDLERARSDLERAFELEPLDLGLLGSLLEVYQRVDDAPAAAKALARTARLTPTEGELQLQLVGLALLADDFPLALQGIDAYLRLEPQSPQHWGIKVDLHVRLDQPEQAREAQRRLLALDPPAELAQEVQQLLDGLGAGD